MNPARPRQVRRAEYDLQQQLKRLRDGIGAPAFAKENVPAWPGANRDPYDAPADRVSGAAARAFYEAFAAAEDHRPTYQHRWSAYATSFDSSDIEH